jgi:uncharacterized cupin superfamily protein
MEEPVQRTKLRTEAKDRFVLLRQELGVSSFGINQIVLGPGQRGRVHRHKNQEEVYLVLEGTLTLLVEGEELKVEAGELVRVAPHLRRQLVNRTRRPVSILALGGAGEHHSRDGEAFRSFDDPTPAPPQEVPLPEDLPASELEG